jgi:hypothetical protein
MAKAKRKLTAAERAARRRRRREFEIAFVNGRQKRVRRPPTIDGLSAGEFIRRNADPVWLHENGMWELMDDGPAAVEDARGNRGSSQRDGDTGPGQGTPGSDDE